MGLGTSVAPATRASLGLATTDAPTFAGIVSSLNKYKTADEDDTTGTLRTDAHLRATLGAGKKYAFKIVAYMSNADGGWQVAVGGVATATSVIAQAIVYNSTGIDNAADTRRMTALDDALSQTNATGSSLYVEIKGLIVVNAGGLFGLRWAQANPDVNPTSVLIGSHMIIDELA